MEIRPVVLADLDALVEIDATVESTRYLHVDKIGEGLSLQWKIEDRPLRTKLIESNPLNDEQRFLLKQIASGTEEGTALAMDHEGVPVGLLLAQPDPARGTLRVIDLRVDYDQRREGFATAMMYQLIQQARLLRVQQQGAKALGCTLS